MNSRILPLLLALFATCAVAAPLDEQRARFLRAYAAAQAGGPATSTLSGGLEAYPLYPYLRFETLKRELPGLPVAAVEDFLRDQRGTPLAARLREAWLRELGQQHQWALYDRFYALSAKPDLACIALRAELELGKLKTLSEAARALWLTPKAASEACSPVFDALYSSGALPDALVRERVWLALHAKRDDFAAYLLRTYTREPKLMVSLLNTLKKQPAQAAALPALRSDTRRNRALLGYAITRLAGQDVKQAQQLWQTVKARYRFHPESRATLLRTLALAAVTQDVPSQLSLLDAVPDTGPDDLLERARLRAALESRSWDRILRWSADPNPFPGNRLRLAYWHARALEENGHAAEARKAYTALATARDYYGFLASDRINAPYALAGRPIAPKQRELNGIKALAGLHRAREFEAIGLKTEANREWLWTLEQLSRREAEVACRVAYEWGWYDRAIFALGKLESYDDTEVRFPIRYKETVMAAAAEREISPARVFSIIRGESAFVVAARSGAGALGLMQLMPATGAETARRNGIPLGKPEDLLIPDKNIQLGSAYLRQVIRQFNGNFALAAAAYNAGPSRVKSWLPKRECVPADLWVETIPFAETEGYVRRALFYAAIYEHHLGLPTTRLSSQLAWLSADGARPDKC